MYSFATNIKVNLSLGYIISLNTYIQFMYTFLTVGKSVEFIASEPSTPFVANWGEISHVNWGVHVLPELRTAGANRRLHYIPNT